jgi:hypothetical protein
MPLDETRPTRRARLSGRRLFSYILVDVAGSVLFVWGLLAGQQIVMFGGLAIALAAGAWLAWKLLSPGPPAD